MDLYAVLPEGERLELLNQFGLPTFSKTEPFDRLARLVSRLLDASGAVVNLVDGPRQYLVGHHGLPELPGRAVAVEPTGCPLVAAEGTEQVIDDLAAHPILSGSVLVNRLGIRAYAGVPLRGPDGRILGALGAIEQRPRRWGPSDLTTLREVADLVVDELQVLRDGHQVERSESHYRWLVENSPNPVFALDRDGRFTGMNAAGSELVGVEVEAILGAHYEDVIGEVDHGRAREVFERVLTGAHDNVAVEVVMVRSDGEARLIRATVLAIRECGKIVGLHGIAEDITEERRVEEEHTRLLEVLADREVRYRGLVEQSLAGFYVLDGERFTYVSPRFAELFGYERAELVDGCVLEELIDPSDWPMVRRHVEDRLQGRATSARYVFRAVRRDGTRFWAEVHGSRREANGRTVVTGVLLDATDRVEAQGALRDSEQRFRSLFEHNPQALFVLDREGRFLDLNPACERLTGYVRSELLGRRARSLVPTGQQDRLIPIRESVHRGEAQWYEHAVEARGGERKEVKVTALPLLEGGEVRGVFGIAEDVGERKRLEAQLAQAKKLEAVGRLAGGVAHDFNNLLTVISGHSEIALDALAEGDPTRWELEEVLRTSRRAATLTRQLLVFSRRKISKPRPLDLNRSISEAQRMLGRVVGADVEIRTSPTEGLWRTMIDRGMVEQVLMNLVINARDAMPDGGIIALSTANRSVNGNGARLPVPVVPGDYVELRVRDTGVGMSEETKAHLFEPFYTTKGVGKGTGLGLSTVYGIVKQAEGFIWVDSRPGDGAVFTIFLPRTLRRPSEEDGGSAADPGPSVRGSVLVVEDEPAVRTLARRVLERRGHRVLDVATPSEALAAVEQLGGEIDLCLTDVVLPEMSGSELARRIAGIRPSIRIGFMSGYAHPAVRANGSLPPNVAVLEKPFSSDALCRMVEGLLRG